MGEVRVNKLVSRPVFNGKTIHIKFHNFFIVNLFLILLAFAIFQYSLDLNTGLVQDSNSWNKSGLQTLRILNYV